MYGDAWRFACTNAHLAAIAVLRDGPPHGYVHDW
jgi:hypothetical protein